MSEGDQGEGTVKEAPRTNEVSEAPATKPQHTPGPWKFEKFRLGPTGSVVHAKIVGPMEGVSRKLIADVHMQHDTYEADGEFLASAPLLEERVQALEKALRTNFEALNRMLTSFVGSDDELCMECGNRVGKGEGCDTCYVIEEATKALAEAERVLQEKP